MLTLRPYQISGARWLKSKRRAYLCDDQGLGKTASTVSAITGRTLVVCPAAAKNVWADEVALWTDLKTKILTMKDLKVNDEYDVYIINYDIFAKAESELPRQWHTIIFDEAHYLKSRKAKRSQTASRFIRYAHNCWLLTGTPIPERVIDLWYIGRAMGFWNYDYRSYGLKFCSGWDTPWNTFDVTGSSNLNELRAMLKPHMLRRTKEQVAPELPEKTFQVIALDLPKDKREKQFDLEYMHKVKEPIAIEGISEILHEHGRKKVKQIAQHINDSLQNEDKIVVFYKHSDVREEVCEILKKKAGLDGKILVLKGGMTDKTRKKAVDLFQNDPQYRVIFVQFTVGKTALTLTAARLLIFAESSWSPEEIAQASDRIHRLGQKRHCLIQFLTIHNSLDEHMLHQAIRKLNVINQIIEPTELDATHRLMEVTMFTEEQAERFVKSMEAIAEGLNKKPKKRKTKAEKEAEEAAAAAAETKTEEVVEQKAGEPAGDNDDMFGEEEAAEEVKYTVEDIRAGLKEYNKAHGKAEAMGLLKKFGAAKVPEVKESDFPAFMKEIEAGLK